MKVLHLTLKKKWFDMIQSRIKREEYRELKPYWVKRFIKFNREVEAEVIDELIQDLKNPWRHSGSIDECLKYFGAKWKEYYQVEFRNGYSKTSPKERCSLNKISVGHGEPQWGAESGVKYFILSL